MLLATLAAAGIGLVGLAPSASAAGFADGQVHLTGHGWGHGRGMGQWGAYGYARAGWSGEQIVAHYYSGTVLADVPDQSIRVRLDSSDASSTQVFSDRAVGGFSIFAPFDPIATQDLSCVRARAVHLGGASYRVECQALFQDTWNVVRASVAGPVYFIPAAASDDLSDMLQLESPGVTQWFRGDLWASPIAGRSYAVNVLALEQYIRGVVPREMPAGWANTGGAEALRAQAIAARSYALALAASRVPDPGYDVCTATCQTYFGRRSGTTDMESPITDAAIASTRGKVATYAGRPILAEYSSSSGGWTIAAGATHPYLAAVPDLGDAVEGNPHHTWTAAIPVSTFEAKYPALGKLLAVDVTGRNGLGEMGGRVTTVVLRGTTGDVTLTGNGFRNAFGVKSDWFAVDGAIEGDPPSSTHGGPSGGLDGYWVLGTDGGIFSFGQARFFGSTGGIALNRPVVGMAPTPSGNGYWLVASDGGIFAFGDAGFFGSTGSLVLNAPIVAMTATASGTGYWMVASDGGVFAFGNAGFVGSAADRALSAPVVGLAPTPSRNGYWMLVRDGRVLPFGDAPAVGAPSGLRVAATAITATRTGGGFLVTTDPGSVLAFGDAPGYSGVREVVPAFGGGIVGIAGHPSG